MLQKLLSILKRIYVNICINFVMSFPKHHRILCMYVKENPRSMKNHRPKIHINYTHYTQLNIDRNHKNHVYIMYVWHLFTLKDIFISCS